jgi:hypothetical protein
MGQWQLGTSLANPNGPNDTIRLNFEVIAGRSVRASINKLEAQRRGSALVLAFYVDDPDLNTRSCTPAARTVRPPRRPRRRRSTSLGSLLWGRLVVEVGEVGADGRDGGFRVVGVVDAEAVEDIEGVLPVCARLLMLV